MFVFALIVVAATALANKSRHWGQPQAEPITPVTQAEVQSVFIPCSDGLSRLFTIVEWQTNCVVLQRRNKTLIVARHKIERLLAQ